MAGKRVELKDSLQVEMMVDRLVVLLAAGMAETLVAEMAVKRAV